MVVERRRLLEYLDRLQGKIIWFSAPAGSGKTTLAASWLDVRRIPCIWYQADEGDADIATFFSYLGAAVKHAAPRYRASLPLFTPEYLLGIPTFTRRYFEILFNRLKPPSCIVIDNYQDVPAESGLHEVLRDGFSIAPEGISVLIMSRGDPPPAFSRLQASGLLEILDRNMIDFTFEESRSLVATLVGKQVSDAVLTALQEKTEGWAAGLVLLTKTLTSGNSHAEFGNIPPDRVFDYFAHELFFRADPQTRDFLMKTSLLPRITAAAAADLTGNGRAEKIFSELSRGNFFTQRHATPEIVYQYHPLFRDFLLSRANETLRPDEIQGIRKKAALLLLATNQVEAALDLLAQAGEWEDVTRLLLMDAQSFISQGRFQNLMEWIGRIPRPLCEKEPWLQFWLGVCNKQIDPPRSRDLFAQALDLFQKQEDPANAFLTWAEIAETFFHEWNDFKPLDRWIAWLDERMAQDAHFPNGEIEARVASCMVNALAFRRPDRPDIESWVQRARKHCNEIANPGMRVQAYANLINYFLWTGDHANSLGMAGEIKNISHALNSIPLMNIIHHLVESSTARFITGDFSNALTHVKAGLETGEKSGIHIWDHLLELGGAFSALCKGDTTVATEYLKRLERTRTSQVHNNTAQYHVLAWMSFLLGDFIQAKAMARKAADEISASGMILQITLSSIVLAAIHHAAGDEAETERYLDQSDRLVQSSGSRMLEFMHLLVRASFILKRGRTPEGMQILRRAMVLGRTEGYVSLAFWWDPRTMADLCATALEQDIEVEYVRMLIRKRSILPPEERPESDPQSVIFSLHADSWPWPVTISTLGGFVIFQDDRKLVFAGRVQQKPLAMLKAIIAFGGKEVSEEQITDALWPDADGDIAHKSFDTNLHRLRKLIVNDNAIVLQDGCVSLNERCCRVDAIAFEQALRNAEAVLKQADGGSHAALQLREKAISLYRGHFLPGDADKSWTVSFRERLRSKFMYCINSLGRHWIEAGRYDKALRVFQNGLEIDDLAEEFYQHLMVCYHQLGQQAEAVRVYNRCRSVLRSSLGLKPSAQTEKIHFAIRQEI